MSESARRPISPPPTKRRKTANRTIVSSPFRLTKIRDLSDQQNVDSVSLHDILGDPLISECWVFNYLHDVGFIMSHFDEDTRSLVKVHIVHGFWRQEDLNRLALQEQAAQFENVTLHTAFMPEMFGTHHTKMFVLIRHDDSAQVVIHTANMIAKDWTNMAQGVWQSPILPLHANDLESLGHSSFGSGQRFKHDLLSYLRAYNTRKDVCKVLVDQLQSYDFSAVRAVLVGSVPGKHVLATHDKDSDKTRWGWPSLRYAIQNIPIRSGSTGFPEIVIQISSIATLGPTDTWIKRTLFGSLDPTKRLPEDGGPTFKIVFPTPDEIRASLDGYVSGRSIHTKIQSPQQAKQLQYLKPYFCHWANDTQKGTTGPGPARESGRRRAAPHIKTYIRYRDNSSPATEIDWAFLTSANISKQAWGEAANSKGEVRISSWELGVLVWPSLLAGDDNSIRDVSATDNKSSSVRMVGAFKKDRPGDNTTDKESKGITGDDEGDIPLVGLRMPYSLPLRRYAEEETPWVETMQHPQRDWKGQTWRI